MKKVPLIRTTEGKQVCANEKWVFFPPDKADLSEELKRFRHELSEFPPELLGDSPSPALKAFLLAMGVEPPKAERLLRGWLLERYKQKPLDIKAEDNRLHLRLLWQLLAQTDTAERNALIKEFRERPLLLVTRRSQPDKKYLLTLRSLKLINWVWPAYHYDHSPLSSS